MAKIYNPVGWEDGEIINPAIADLTTGIVTPAEVSGTTPVNAENLKHMDEAIKQLYDEGASSKDIYIGNDNPPEDTKIWINNDEISPAHSEVVNSLDGNETTKAPSVQAVNNRFSYSTEEKVIGTWINGKLLYRKTIKGTVSKAGSGVIIGTISNLDVVTKKYGEGLAANTYWTELDFKHSDTIYSIIQANKNNGQLIAVFGTGFLNYPFHLTIEYTKTTDTATNTAEAINDEPISEEVTI